MRTRRPYRKLTTLAAAPLMLALASAPASAAPAAVVPAAAAVPPAAAAAPCVSMTGTQPPSPGNTGSILLGTVVRSPCDSWAVGTSINVNATDHKSQLLTLIVRWDGARWTQVAGQDPGSAQNLLYAVAATSATNAWAVGTFFNSGSPNQTLIEHWDGTSWTQVPSPSPGTGSQLFAVAATSATNAWAVGYFIPPGGSARQTLIEHWDGRSWIQVPSPGAGTLNGVVGIGWAVGQQPASSGADQTLIEHWDGRTWSVVPGAGLGAGSTGSLAAVSATSPASIWAVGKFNVSNGAQQMLIEHYDGTSWTQSASPGPGSLAGVSATGASDAWAVGAGTSSSAPVVHYDGTSWVPVPVHAGGLNAVSASSPASVWAVGSTPTRRSLALHLRCC